MRFPQSSQAAFAPKPGSALRQRDVTMIVLGGALEGRK
jgi:hypothetical protein